MVRQIQGGHFLFRCHRNFYHPIKFILKDFVCLFDVFEGETVGNQRSCVNIALLDEREDFVTVATVNTARFENQILAVHIGQRKTLRFIVKCNNRDNRIRSCTLHFTDI